MLTLYTMPETCSLSPNIAAAILAWLGATYGGEGYARETRLVRLEADEGVKRALARQSMEPIG